MFPVLINAQASNWEWAIGGTDVAMGNGNDVVTDDSGNVYITGVFSNTLSIGSFSVTSIGSTDIFVAKFNSSGQIIWLIGEGGAGEDKGFGIEIDQANNIYVCGFFSSSITIGTTTYTSEGEKDILWLKYDNAGSLLASKVWGDIYSDVATKIFIDDYDKIYLTGYFEDTVNFDSYTLISEDTRDMLLLKLDTGGNVIWARKAGGQGGNYGWDINVDNTGIVYVTGFAAGHDMHFGSITTTNTDVFISSFDTSGAVLWANSIDAIGIGVLYGNSVSSDVSGNVYITGFSFQDQNMHFGSTILSGNNSYVAKYNSSGNLVWAKGIATNTIDGANYIVVDSGKNIYIAGFLDYWGVFGADTIYTNGGEDVFIAKLDSNGNYIWSALAGGSGTDGAYSLTLDNNGSIVLTGYTTSSISYFGPYTINGASGQDMFVAKLSQTTGLPVVQGSDKQLYIYPNPANDMLYVKGVKENAAYKIQSITGATVKEGVLQKNHGAIDIQDISPGLYLLHAAGEVHKIVKE